MTTSHTANLDLPYPEGDEYVIGGDDAIEALAKAVDTVLVASYFDSTLADGSAAYVHGGGHATVTLNGPLNNSADFTYAAGVVTYTGPRRAYLITGSAVLRAVDGSQAVLDLEVGGALRRRVDAFPVAQWFSGTVSWAGLLLPGTPIRMAAQAPAGTEVWYPALSIVACGAAQG